MTNKIFISELHDIGKLVDWDSTQLKGIRSCVPKHTFHNFDFSQSAMLSKPSSPSWWGQFHHDDIKSLTSNKIPLEYIADVILTKIADELAASISRTWVGNNQKGEVGEGVYVLWNPSFFRKEVDRGNKWAAFSTLNELKEMFSFVDSCNSAEEFFEKYRGNLRLTAEDKSAPLNIVNLLSHLELTGKIYRVLKRHSRFDNQERKLIYCGNAIQQITEATGGRIDKPNLQGKWVYRLIFCNIFFPQSLIRLQDLNIFKKRKDLIKSFLEDINIKDYVLFSTDDFMCLFIPKEAEIKIQEILNPFLKAGFLIDYQEMEAELNLLTSSMGKAYEKFHTLGSQRKLKLYKKTADLGLTKELSPPLCDSCQMRQGKERVKDQIREYLCDACYEIREMGEPAVEYAKWEGKAVWMKISLDQEQLVDILQTLFEKYVDSQTISDSAALKESFRPLAVQIDFMKDYKLLLKAFSEKIYEIKNDEGTSFFTKETFIYPIDGYYEFGIFKVCSEKAILMVLDLFYDVLNEYFPECIKESPIRLSLSIANVKYPYQQHWRFLSDPKNIINIQCPMSAQLSIDTIQYKLLKEKIMIEDIKLSHFLCRLVDIEIKTKSDITVSLEIFNNRKEFSGLLELIRNGLQVHQILAFYKLTREQVIYE